MTSRRLIACSVLVIASVACGGRAPEAAPEPDERRVGQVPEAATAEAAPEVPDEAKRERALERERLVQRSIQAKGVSDPAVLRAMRGAPRHRFVPEKWRHAAYEDRALPIGQGQTISQPFVVASMTEELRLGPGSKVLEIGTGSG